eukprot:TRINITY_DN74805_c0_g1_i1.p1 TRINITY_DN74805_c0_g1~~TRINITY_DN74805_c0_g1_i1.p1  ORF type:complete len:494 (+),score=54.64 TRINITY_DN74805_c0_g1_i1:13-1494(+)
MFRVLSSGALREGQLKYLVNPKESLLHKVHFLKQGAPILPSCFPLESEFSGKPSQVFVQSHESGKTMLVGLGKDPKAADIRKATHTAISTLNRLKIPQADLHIPQTENVPLAQLLSIMSQIGHLSNYKFDVHVSDTEKKNQLQEINFVVPDDAQLQDAQEAVNKGDLVGTAVAYARELGNIRGDHGNPQFYEDEILTCVKQNDNLRLVKLISGVGPLQAEGLNLLAAVGQGASIPPRLVIVKYEGNPESDESVALVGKGVTYDTGGLHVKPFGSMEDMHMDMCGTATVMGTMWGLSQLKPKINVYCVYVLAENAIGCDAYKPGSIIKSLKGLTVEILNTDAEGRLCLVDGMTYVQQNYKPKTMVDFATLTGAMVMAVGEYYGGLFTPHDELARQLLAAGEEEDDRAWRMPIGEEYTEELKGTHSDLCNISMARKAGASSAACFLQKFVEDGVQWAHFDIAGSGMYSKDRGYKCKGATGYGVSLMLNWLQSQSA